MAEQGDPQAKQMCADIEAHGKVAERKEGGVHHRRASSMSGFVKARAEIPEETKPNKKDSKMNVILACGCKVVDDSKVSKTMSPQTKEELQDALSDPKVGALDGIANKLDCHDKAIALETLLHNGKGFPKMHWIVALLDKQHEVHHIACVSKNCILLF